VVGIALLMSGFGFAILTIFGALGNRDIGKPVPTREAPAVTTTPLPTVYPGLRPVCGGCR